MRALAALIVAGLAGTAFAQPTRDVVDSVEPERIDEHERPLIRPLRVPLVVIEHLSILVPPMIWYWATTPVQREDFDMDWDLPSWRKKLTSPDAFILDTGHWTANAVRHPLAGYLGYQISRTNGFSRESSLGMTLASSAFWEYFIEYKELISVNDLVTNTVSGFSIGEPLFQLGRLADERRAGWARKGLGLLASPYQRVHSVGRYSSWSARDRTWSQLEASAGVGLGTHDGADRVTGRVALDLELVTDRAYGRTGSGTRKIGPGAWNHVILDLRAGGDAMSSGRFATRTTVVGYYARELAPGATGSDWFAGAVAGVDYVSQRLAREWDHLFVMHVIGPALEVGSWKDGTRMSWQLAGYLDLGMTYAHVFGPDPQFVPEPPINVLQRQGYYYASGVSVATRVRADARRWVAELEARAHQLWSIDGLDRVEMDGGPNDPHDVTDQRAFGRASFGVRPGSSPMRVELAIEGALRRGAWSDHERVTSELSAHTGVVVPF